MITEGLLEKAGILINQQRYDEAELLLGQLFTQYPDNYYLLYLLGEVQFLKRDYARAEELINTAIALNPEEGNLYFSKSRIYMMRDKYREAEDYIAEAVALNPSAGAYYAQWAQIKLLRKEYSEALELANEALALDPSDVFALNVRSTALLKLNRKEESFDTISEALHEDPNNDYTHSNYGWGLLEKGNAAQALIHFKEALRHNPNSLHAQMGMTEALKARFTLYRWFLQYSFWLTNKAAKFQWFFILGFYFGTKTLRRIADENESLQPFLYPLVALLFLFAFSTWIIEPVSNLFLRLNPFGKYLLTDQEKVVSSIIGACILTSLLSAITFYITDMSGFMALGLFMFTMMIPLGSLYREPRNIFITYNVVMGIVGTIAVIQAFTANVVFSGLAILYMLGLVAFQFIANYYSTRNS